MVELIFSPNWFYGKDIGIDIVSIITLLIITLFSYRLYKLSKEQKYGLYTLGFFALTLSFIFKIFTNFELYYNTIQTQNNGLISFTYHVANISNIPFFTGFIGYRALTFIGLFLLYLVYYKERTDRVTILLYTYLFDTLYVLGELVQLIGSLLLLWTLALILYHGKKTK